MTEMADARQELATIFKRNRRLAELNPEVAAEVLSGKTPKSLIPARLPRLGTQQADSSSNGVAAPDASNAVNPATLQPATFTVPGSPVPKPRQTRSDKWKKRPSVVRYRRWADDAREAYNAAKRKAFPDVRFLGTIRYERIQAVAFFKMPGSWNAATKAKMSGQPHCLRPDADNILKAIGDSLFPTGDEHLYDLHITKRWDDGEGARTVITLW